MKNTVCVSHTTQKEYCAYEIMLFANINNNEDANFTQKILKIVRNLHLLLLSISSYEATSILFHLLGIFFLKKAMMARG
jgi:hypothetical protein